MTAKKNAVSVLILSAGNRGLEHFHAILFDELSQMPVRVFAGRAIPVCGQDVRMNFGIITRRAFRAGKVEKVAVEVDIVFIDPAIVGESIRVHCMDK